MAAQLAENLLQVLWLDRCRQAQRLTQGGADAAAVVRIMLCSFIEEQGWGFEPGVFDDEGVYHEGCDLNFSVLDDDHFAEDLLFNRLRGDIERGEWMPVEGYIRRTEFFGGFPRNSLRRLPPGAPSR